MPLRVAGQRYRINEVPAGEGAVDARATRWLTLGPARMLSCLKGQSQYKTFNPTGARTRLG